MTPEDLSLQDPVQLTHLVIRFSRIIHTNPNIIPSQEHTPFGLMVTTVNYTVMANLI
jgi:hypothetical protein